MITIVDSQGRTLHVLDLATAVALADQPFTYTDPAGKTTTVDPQKLEIAK